MAVIKPFAALRYNESKIANLGDVLAPPYDHLHQIKRDQLFAASPYNIAHLTPPQMELIGEHADRTVRQSADLLTQWQSEDILVKDPQPAMYYYRMGFTHGDNQRTVRRGFFALLQLEPNNSSVVLPQQSDWMTPRPDRLQLRRALRTNCAPIFLLFSDPEREVMSLLAGAAENRPMVDSVDMYGREHSIYRLLDHDAQKRVVEIMNKKTVTMADGHHRYRTAQAYAEAFPEDPGGKNILACFVPIQDEGLVAMPIHRAVSGLPDLRIDEFLFDISQIFYIRELETKSTPQESVQAALAELAELAAEGEPAFVMGLPNMRGLVLLTVKSDAAKLAMPDGVAAPIRDLDTALLQRLVLEGMLKLDPTSRDKGDLLFFEDPYRLPALLSEGAAQLVFLCNPIRSNQLISVAEARLKLPHKVSRFVPEVPAGLVLQSFDDVRPNGGIYG